MRRPHAERYHLAAGQTGLRRPTAPPSIGAQIWAELERQGIGVTELARRMSRDHGHVSRVVNGRYAPGPEFLQDAADALGIELTVPATPEARYAPRGGQH